MYVKFNISGSGQLGLTSGWLRSQQPFIHPCISWSWIKIISSIRLGHLKGIGSKVSLWICVHCPVQFLQERGGGCRNDFGINSILNKQKCTFALSLKIGNVCLFMDAIEGFDTLRPAQYQFFAIVLLPNSWNAMNESLYNY